MKSALLFIAFVMGSLASQAAIKDGVYSCHSPKGLVDITYKFKTVAVDGIEMPYLDVTQYFHKNPEDPNSQEHVYTVKGFATQFGDEQGGERLALAALTIELKSGRPACAQ